MNISNLVAKVITGVFVVMANKVTVATVSALVSLVTESALVMLSIRVVCKFMQVLIKVSVIFVRYETNLKFLNSKFLQHKLSRSGR